MYPFTVDVDTLKLRAMARWLTPAARNSLNTSLNIRMDSLCADIHHLRFGVARVGRLASVVNRSCSASGAFPLPRNAVRLGPEWAFGLLRNRRSASPGMGVRLEAVHAPEASGPPPRFRALFTLSVQRRRRIGLKSWGSTIG
jgi:hypothetical protein